MRLFRRSKPVQNVPPEVAEYYQAERRERRGVAWLMTLLTLLITVALIVGLFFAGRWAYQRIWGGDSVPSSQNDSGDDSGRSDSGSDSPIEGPSNQESDEDATERNQARDDSGSSRETREDTPAQTPESTREDRNQGGTGSSGTTPPQSGPSELADTGPGETVAGVFVVSAVSGYVIYRRKLSHSRV